MFCLIKYVGLTFSLSLLCSLLCCNQAVDACVVGTDILQTAHTNMLCHHPNIIIIINNLIIIIITRSGMRTQPHLAEKRPPRFVSSATSVMGNQSFEIKHKSCTLSPPLCTGGPLVILTGCDDSCGGEG